ncbi:MAG TPA: xanthine dehydrogenase family protein subunit M [Aggregatilineaceae bacterium]|nr:xanthine dehydrogenase family protein subunit M [Aggregatilineaceae bacterium]
MQEFDFHAAETLDDLHRLLAETGGRVIAGGTDVLVQMQRGLFPATCLIDASRVCDLRFITEQAGWIHVGSLTTYADLLASPLLRDAAPALVEAAATIGAPQTRSRGTLGGNIANASPAADSLPPLLTLNAQVRLTRSKGERVLPLSEVLRGPRQTCIQPDEIIHSISFARLPDPSGAAFLKLGNRDGMAIAVVNVAVALVLAGDRRIAEARVALGAVAPTPVRSPKAEAAMAGQRPTSEAIEAAARAMLADIGPISDIRGTAEYRRRAATHLFRRALHQALERAGGRLET